MIRVFSRSWSESPVNRRKMSLLPSEETAEVPKQNFIISKLLDQIGTLCDFYEYVRNYESALKIGAKNTVLFSGKGKLMIIGEAPGSMEDETGVPFVGDSGKLLNEALENAGLKREEVYVTNLIYWRPCNNRTPTEEEIKEFAPLLLKHIALFNPKAILCLGASALKALFGNQYKITNVRGKILSLDSWKVVPSFHPSYILRLQKQKGLFLEDIKIFKNTGD